MEAINGVTQAILLDLENGVVDAQKPSVKAGIIRDLSVSHGILHDKERLERNLSTSNISLIGRMMADAFHRAGKVSVFTEAEDQTPSDNGPLSEHPA